MYTDAGTLLLLFFHCKYKESLSLGGKSPYDNMSIFSKQVTNVLIEFDFLKLSFPVKKQIILKSLNKVILYHLYT